MTFTELLRAPLSNLQSIKLLQLVLKHLSLSREDSVLSVGTGNGFDCFIISKYAQDVVGVDIAEPMIKFLNESPKPHNVRFYAVDTTTDPPSEFLNMFDKCICLEVLEHVEDPEGLLQFVEKSLRRGGRLVMTFPINNPTHGQNYLTEERVSRMFEKTLGLDVKTWAVGSNRLSRFLDRFYFKVQNVLKPPKKEADIFENTTAFEMITKPNKLYILYKIGIILLSKIPGASYCAKEGSGDRLLVIAEKI